MYKAYKFRNYQNEEQKIFISKTFDCSIYTYYLNKVKNGVFTNSYTNIKDYTNVLKYSALFLQEVDKI